jgi:hypothetical protein
MEDSTVLGNECNIIGIEKTFELTSQHPLRYFKIENILIQTTPNFLLVVQMQKWLLCFYP